MTLKELLSYADGNSISVYSDNEGWGIASLWTSGHLKISFESGFSFSISPEDQELYEYDEEENEFRAIYRESFSVFFTVDAVNYCKLKGLVK